MDSEKNKKAPGKACSTGSNSESIVVVHAGQLCPVCGFAKLEKEPGNIVKCPVCGYGSSIPNT
jgi:rubrerythrin